MKDRASLAIVWCLLMFVGCGNTNNISSNVESLSAVERTEESEKIVSPTIVSTQDINLFPLNDEIPSLEFCDCRFVVTEDSDFICLKMMCSESCSEQTRLCASRFGGCVVLEN